MKPMNWEPMTEDAVFKHGELVLVCHVTGDIVSTDYMMGMFYIDDTHKLEPSTITHFCRITNPNEVEP